MAQKEIIQSTNVKGVPCIHNNIFFNLILQMMILKQRASILTTATVAIAMVSELAVMPL